MDGLDRKKLEEELSTAVERERTHYEVDNMKKRAIGTAATYDEFKNLVACAGLKPMDKDDFAKKAVVSANKGVRSTDSARFGFEAPSSTKELKTASAINALGAKLAAGAAPPSIRTASDFDRQWRRIAASNSDQRLSYVDVLPVCRFSPVSALTFCRLLQSITGECLRRIFQKDLDAALLLDIITFFCALLRIGIVTSDVTTIEETSRTASQTCLQVLDAMVAGPGFTYAKKMLSRSERDLGVKLVLSIKFILSSPDDSVMCENIITALSG